MREAVSSSTVSSYTSGYKKQLRTFFRNDASVMVITGKGRDGKGVKNTLKFLR